MSESIYDKPEGVYVVIENRNTGEVASVMGPMSGRRADRVEDGASHNLDWAGGWFVIVTDTLTDSQIESLQATNKQEG